MSLRERMSGWVHRSHPPVAPSVREIVDPIICPECCDKFATAAQFYFHHCPSED